MCASALNSPTGFSSKTNLFSQMKIPRSFLGGTYVVVAATAVRSLDQTVQKARHCPSRVKRLAAQPDLGGGKGDGARRSHCLQKPPTETCIFRAKDP